MGAAGLTGETNHQLQSVDFYTSHEALLLEYEEALCRVDSTSGKTACGVGSYDLDRRQDAAAGRRACGVLQGCSEPDWPEMRAVDGNG